MERSVLFENLTDIIVTRCDELGMPKVCCEIDIERSFEPHDMQAFWPDASFASINIAGLDVVDNGIGEIGSELENELVYRYMPAVGEKGRQTASTLLSYRIAEEANKSPSTTTSAMTSKKAYIRFHKLEKERLPTLHHVACSRKYCLLEIPIYEVLGLGLSRDSGGDLSSARRIE